MPGLAIVPKASRSPEALRKNAPRASDSKLGYSAVGKRSGMANHWRNVAESGANSPRPTAHCIPPCVPD